MTRPREDRREDRTTCLQLGSVATGIARWRRRNPTAPRARYPRPQATPEMRIASASSGCTECSFWNSPSAEFTSAASSHYLEKPYRPAGAVNVVRIARYRTQPVRHVNHRTNAQRTVQPNRAQLLSTAAEHYAICTSSLPRWRGYPSCGSRRANSPEGLRLDQWLSQCRNCFSWEDLPMLLVQGIKGPRASFVTPLANIHEWDRD